jgi:hypothetical protein
MNKKIFLVKIPYFNFLKKNLKIPCFPKVYGEFFFNWSTETGKQFMKHLMSMQPTKFFISSSAEVEAVTSKTDLFMKIMENYNKIGNKKIDKFELISIIPFILDNNFENCLFLSLSYFCLENEGIELITKDEVGLFFDSFFRAVHNIIIIDEEFNKEEIYTKTKNNIIKLSEQTLEEILNKIFDNKQIEEMNVNDVIKKIPNDVKILMENVNKGFYESLKFFGEKIREENL